jgi:hypothetical protein
MSATGHSRARNVRFSVLIVSDAATLILSDAQHECRPDTLRVVALDLKTLFTVTGKDR